MIRHPRGGAPPHADAPGQDGERERQDGGADGGAERVDERLGQRHVRDDGPRLLREDEDDDAGDGADRRHAHRDEGGECLGGEEGRAAVRVHVERDAPVADVVGDDGPREHHRAGHRHDAERDGQRQVHDEVVVEERRGVRVGVRPADGAEEVEEQQDGDEAGEEEVDQGRPVLLQLCRDHGFHWCPPVVAAR
ncbi:hypothetical protein [Corynebacterium bovis]|uniref:Uncharacterized protein n=1 Tax=Corynebacterium bovis DSM 20582 = CIP 54.80 TaxID=927655 RepID=A0A8H9Y5E5_9CORY|nr:hypothetical protein [Corynebacterium bovis]MBB3115292.1 hypothetical protein [Corynebacterium bovis DSM 20582 = CIP 54.80]QQC48186.1 hypothetical protein I6I09_04700 [Corynebacterium bovis]